MCNFLGSVLPQQKFEAMDGSVLQLGVTTHFLFDKQRKMHPQGERAGRPKRLEENISQLFNFGSSFYMFFLLALSLLYVNWASQEGCLLYLRFSLLSSDIPLFYFHRLFPSPCFSHPHSGLLFPILTT